MPHMTISQKKRPNDARCLDMWLRGRGKFPGTPGHAQSHPGHAQVHPVTPKVRGHQHWWGAVSGGGSLRGLQQLGAVAAWTIVGGQRTLSN